MPSQRSLKRVLLMLPVIPALSGCAAGMAGAYAQLAAMQGANIAADQASSPTNVIDKYTDEEFQRCLDNLTLSEEMHLRDRFRLLDHVPIGVQFSEEEHYRDIEQICQEKGILPVADE